VSHPKQLPPPRPISDVCASSEQDRRPFFCEEEQLQAAIQASMQGIKDNNVGNNSDVKVIDIVAKNLSSDD
jgi:hypothetical protein